MKNTFKFIIALLFLSTIIGCNKESVIESTTKTPTSNNPYGIGKGQLTVFVKSNVGGGRIYVKIDGQSVGTITNINSSGVQCGMGDVNYITTAGPHLFSATSDGGKQWSGNVAFTADVCNSLELK